MARELRPRKPAAESRNGTTTATKNSEKTPVKKRKALEDNSPIPGKVHKASKKTLGDKSKSKKPVSEPTKTNPPADEQPEEALDDEDEEAQDEEGVLALANELDPEDDDPADEGAAFQAGQDVGEIPKIVKPAKSDKKSDGERGVVYIGRIPHGFYEHEMRQYFKQFGPISRLRLSRNKKTGASKHFAFIEFAEASTAEVVAKTMNNYLLFGHILKCTVIPKETVHEDLFKGANRRYKKVPWNKMAGRQLEQGHTEADWNKRVSQEQKKRNKTVSKLKALGYEFDAPELKEAPSAPVVEEEQPEVKAIEAQEATNGNTEKNDEDTAAEPANEKTISAPKTKSGRSGQGKKAKA